MNPIGGLDGHAASRSPSFGGFEEVHHSPPVSVAPREGRNRQQLPLVQLKQPLDDREFQNLGGDKDDRSEEKMSGAEQVAAEGFGGLQHDERHGKKRKRLIRAQRRRPSPHPLKQLFPAEPGRQ